MITQIKNFKKISIPRSIDSLIQECALNHLGVKDIGKLRDKYEGQRYYDVLKNDIYSEYAFEKFLGEKKFDWDLRKKKAYKRKHYVFNNHPVQLINFSLGTFPLLNLGDVQNVIFVYIKPDLKIFISGVATKNILESISARPSNYSPLFRDLKEVNNFKTLPKFENKNELISILSNIQGVNY